MCQRAPVKIWALGDRSLDFGQGPAVELFCSGRKERSPRFGLDVSRPFEVGVEGHLEFSSRGFCTLSFGARGDAPARVSGDFRTRLATSSGEAGRGRRSRLERVEKELLKKSFFGRRSRFRKRLRQAAGRQLCEMGGSIFRAVVLEEGFCSRPKRVLDEVNPKRGAIGAVANLQRARHVTSNGSRPRSRARDVWTRLDEKSNLYG